MESVIVIVELGCALAFAFAIAFATLLAKAFGTVIAAVVLAALVLTGLAGIVVCVLRVSHQEGHGHDDDKLEVGDLVKEKEGKEQKGEVIKLLGENVRVLWTDGKEQTGKVIELLGKNVKVRWTGDTSVQEDNNCEPLMTGQLKRIPLEAKYQVRVRVLVLKVVNIDLAAQNFTVDVQFEASWESQELTQDLKEHLTSHNKKVEDVQWDEVVKDVQWDENNTNQERGQLWITFKTEDQKKNQERGKRCIIIKNKDQKEPVEEKFFVHFAPRLKLTNLIGKVNQERWFDFYAGTKKLSGEPGPVIVCYKWKLEQATFQESMELDKFPFDTQLLTMKLCTGWPLDDKENSVQLLQNKKGIYRSFVTTDHFLQSSEYTLFNVLKFDWKYTKRAVSASNEKYSLLYCSMLVERRIGYWYTNVMLPIFIVTSCVLPSYAVPPDEFGDRAAIVFTLLLAQVAYKYVIADKLPKISYMTHLDSYVFFCFASTFIVVILQFCENRNIIPHRVLQCSNFTMSGCTVMNTSSVNYDIPVSTTTPNPTTTTSSDDADWTRIDLSPPVREVQLCVYFLWLSIAWLLLHLMLVCAFACMKFQRHRKNASWNCSWTSVWVSPLHFADDADPGSVVSITITDAGAGYGSTAPMVTLSKPDESTGTQATAKAILTDSSISGISIEKAGSGYTKAPIVTIKPADGVTPSETLPTKSATAVAILTDSVANIEITDAGTEYDSESTPDVKISEPAKSGGTQATATATVEKGKITDITITCAGSGYTSPPEVTLSKPKNGGKQATAAASLPPTRKECLKALDLLCKTYLCDNEASPIILWMPNEADEALKNSGSCDKCHHPCAVVRFEGPHAEERAAELVNKFETRKDKLCNPRKNVNTWQACIQEYYPLKNANGEHLSQGYKALEDCKTYQRIQERLGAGRFVGPRSNQVNPSDQPNKQREEIETDPIH